MKKLLSHFQSVICLSSVLLIISCNRPGEVPFPEEKLAPKPPVIVPLVFSEPKKIQWDTISQGDFKPIVQELHIDDLPAIPYDYTGFKPFKIQPGKTSFDFNSLPIKDLKLDSLPTYPLEFKTSILGPVGETKAAAPLLQPGKALGIYDFGKPQGFVGNFVGEILIKPNGISWLGGDGLWSYDGSQIRTYINGGPTNPPVTGLIEDREENIWFIKAGTGNIGRVDTKHGTIGYSSKIGGYRNNKNPMTLDSDGNIWVNNILAKAVSIINPGSGTYKNLTYGVGLSDSSAYHILEDKNRNIWITTTKGVSIIDPVNHKIKYLTKANGLSYDSISAMTEGPNGNLWLATSQGLDAVDINSGKITHYGSPELKTPYAFTLKFDNLGQLWVASVTGIMIVNIKEGSIRTITTQDGLTTGIITDLELDKQNRMWISTATGVNMIDQCGKTVHPFGTTAIISTEEDEIGNLWVATRDGLYIVNPERTSMHLLNTKYGLTNNFVQAFFKQAGKMIVTTNGGFNIIDPVNNTLIKAGEKEGLANDTIYVAYSDDNNNIWLTGPSNGIDVVNTSENILLHTDKSGGLSDNAILDINGARNGLIWLATQENGIDVFDPETGTIKNVSNQPGLSNQSLRMLQEDQYGRMWIGTNMGIYIADSKNNTLTHLSTKQGLTSNTVLSLLTYKESMVAGTGNKISIINAPAPGDSTEKWTIHPLAKSEGIVKEVNSWSTDAISQAGEYYWGDNGMTVIYAIQASKDTVPTYITGLTVMTEPLDFVNHYQLSAQDSLYGADTVFTQGQKPVNTGYVEESKILWDSVFGDYNLPAKLTLPYDQNYLSFQFAEANLGRQDTTFYTYILEGIDNSWSTPSEKTYSENYLNLPYGNYTFKVSSKGLDNTWSEPVSFSFTIRPPWYQTWWAYALFALAAIGILRAYIVHRSRRLKRENRVLEERVSNRTSQLKKTIEELKSTQSQLVQSEKMASLGELTAGIAHEIQNPLNFVNNFSEVNKEMIIEMNEEIGKGNYSEVKILANDIKENEEKIIHHGKRADAIVKSMLQHSRGSSGQKEPIDINALTDEYLRLAYHGLRAKDKSFNADFKTDFDESLGKINVVAQDIGRVILNLITNAFYAVNEKKKQFTGHGEQGYRPSVTVSTAKVDSHWVSIKVRDNGNGIPESVRAKIFQPFFTTKPSGQGTGLGLSMAYDIVRGHGGELTVNTNEGEFTEFMIKLPY